MNATLSTLAGVALGALLTGGISFALARAAFKRDVHERRRAERLDIISKFQRHTDELWRSRQDLGVAILEIQGDKQDDAAWARRAAAFEEGRPARHEALFLLAQIRLLIPPLVKPAEALLEASERWDQMKSPDNLADRKKAQKAFEDVARSLIADA